MVSPSYSSAIFHFNLLNRPKSLMNLFRVLQSHDFYTSDSLEDRELGETRKILC